MIQILANPSDKEQVESWAVRAAGPQEPERDRGRDPVFQETLILG